MSVDRGRAGGAPPLRSRSFSARCSVSSASRARSEASRSSSCALSVSTRCLAASSSSRYWAMRSKIARAPLVSEGSELVRTAVTVAAQRGTQR